MSARSTATLASETLDKRELLKVESGGSDYLAKPVDLDELFPPMRVWTDDRRHRTASRASAAI
jgi:DNA-binding response OmpR family regulator